MSAVWQLGWRVVLALALAGAPELGTAHACAGDAPVKRCPHHASNPASDSGSKHDCKNGCCGRKGCDASRCVVLTAAIAVPDQTVVASKPLAVWQGGSTVAPRALPLSERLRPPIA